MGEHFKSYAAVMLFLFREAGNKKEILLQKRCNTGYMDNQWDCGASGHVEENESLKEALIREAKEELNINIPYENVKFASFTHKYTKETGVTYYNAYFAVNNYSGTLEIAEPDKCSELKWFDIKELPESIIEDRKEALNNYLQGITYDEFGWQ